MKKLKFSKDWKKLNDPIFTTIRRRTDLEEGNIIDIISPKKKFKGIVLFRTSIELSKISTSLLTYDTDTLIRNEAIKVLNSFYQKEIKDYECVELLVIRGCD